MKIIKVDLPYPSMENVTEDVKSARIIASAYAGSHGELSAILQYVYHAFYFEKNGDEDTAEILDRIAMAEMHHLEIIGKLLLKLGADPIYTACPPYKNSYYNTSQISYSKTRQKMLMDDLSGEIYAVESYKKMLDLLTNEDVSAIIQRIMLDEELHVKVLKTELEKFT